MSSGDVQIHTVPKASAEDGKPQLNRISSQLTQSKIRGGAQAMLYAVGLTEEDMNKPQIGISPIWWEGNPCNSHLLDLAYQVKDGCKDEDMVGLIFNTIGVSDAITMGTDGMRYSLPSRDIIADSIESVVMAQHYDGNISIPGCDKNMPGCFIAAARHNRPTIIVYGGTIQAGTRHIDCPSMGYRKGGTVNISDAFESYGAYAVGKIDDDERFDVVRHACPGAGACGGMYTANTMSSALEALGMSLPYSSSTPAMFPEKKQECFRAAKYLKQLLELDIKPKDILTRNSFLNAIVIITVLGGSTNAVLHLLAMARAADVELSVDDFQLIGTVIDYRNWHLALGRRFRSLKLWFVLRSFGAEGFRRYIRKTIALNQQFANFIAGSDVLSLITPPFLALSVFRLDPKPKSPNQPRLSLESLNNLNRLFYGRISARNDILLTQTVLNGVYCIRLAVGAARTEASHIQQACQLLHKEAELALEAWEQLEPSERHSIDNNFHPKT